MGGSTKGLPFSKGEFDNFSKIFREHITSEQYGLLKYYSRLGFISINGSLRRGEGESEESHLISKSMLPLDRDITVFRKTFTAPDWMRVGAEFTDKGFVSTSMDMNTSQSVGFSVSASPSYDGTEPKYHIYVPKGTKVASMGNVSNLDEGEVIIQSGTKFRVRARKDRIIELEVING